MSQPRSISLIFISLALLAVFELLWLKRVWREQFENLQQETDYLFQQSVVALQDTLIYKSMHSNRLVLDNRAVPMRDIRMQQMHTEKSQTDSISRTFLRDSTAKIIVRMDMNSGNLPMPNNFEDSNLKVFVMRTGDGDSLPIGGLDRLLLDLPAQFHNSIQGSHVFKFEKNSIPITGLDVVYRQKLQTAGISLDFDIFHNDSLPFALPSTVISTKPIRAGLLVNNFYAAVFPNYQAYLLRKMLPALAFALLLFGITSAAFFLIYRSLRQQQRLTRLKNEFISNITHELKTPITTVGVALEALSNFEVRENPEKSREYLAHSKLELDRLSLLVEKVLRMSMFEAQEPRMKLERLDLTTVVQQVAKAMTLQAQRVGATIQIHAPEGTPFPVNGDRLHLSSVVFNLLDNALKYTGDQPRIHVFLENANDRIRLSVRDNGVGIPTALQSKVFDKFFRVQDGDRHEVKGHGLGLSYAATVVRQHGGRIWVESQPGSGSTFFVEFENADADSD